MREKLLLMCRIFTIAFLVAGVIHPPASVAQTSTVGLAGMQIKDAIQDERIDELKVKTDLDTATIKDNTKAIATLALQFGEMRGEERGMFGALSILITIQTLLGLRRRGEERKTR